MMTGIHSRPYSAAAALLALSAILQLPQDAAHAATTDITPFKAVYALDFAPAGQNSPFSGGKGRLTVELTGSRCTDYRMIRTVDGTVQSDRGPLTLKSEAVFAENAAGTQLGFSFVERSNGKITRQETLVARRNDSGTITVTSANLPGGKTQLPQGVLLPLHHERMAIDAITSGRKSLSASIYNPEDSLTSIDQISYSVGPEVTNALPKGHPAAIDALQKTPRYRIELIRNSKAGKPRVRERMTRFVNSILTTSHATFEHLQIKANLASLTMLPVKPCR